ncbi:MAG: hypothetical protein ACKOZU_00570 [Planctomycetaceae bacterium]
MRRRHWFAAVALLAAGCSSSSSSAKKKKKSGKVSGIQRMKAGPQGFGNVLIPAYIDDLKTGSAEKKITAAQELGNMGSRAKEALPALEKLVSDKNPKVSGAAKAAVAAIKKR